MLERLKRIVCENTDVNSDIIIDESTVILRDLGIDSLDIVELICVVEDEFCVEIADKDIKKLITIGDIITYIETHQ